METSVVATIGPWWAAEASKTPQSFMRAIRKREIEKEVERGEGGGEATPRPPRLRGPP